MEKPLLRFRITVTEPGEEPMVFHDYYPDSITAAQDVGDTFPVGTKVDVEVEAKEEP